MRSFGWIITEWIKSVMDENIHLLLAKDDVQKRKTPTVLSSGNKLVRTKHWVQFNPTFKGMYTSADAGKIVEGAIALQC